MPVTVNGYTIEEGMTVWRLANLTVGVSSFEEQDPNELIEEAARQLSQTEELEGTPQSEILSNLQEDIGYYDDLELLRYQSMEVTEVFQEPTSITLKDTKERSSHKFVPEEYIENSSSTVIQKEPLSALEKHLGKTLHPV